MYKTVVVLITFVFTIAFGCVNNPISYMSQLQQQKIFDEINNHLIDEEFLLISQYLYSKKYDKERYIDFKDTANEFFKNDYYVIMERDFHLYEMDKDNIEQNVKIYLYYQNSAQSLKRLLKKYDDVISKVSLKYNTSNDLLADQYAQYDTFISQVLDYYKHALESFLEKQEQIRKYSYIVEMKKLQKELQDNTGQNKIICDVSLHQIIRDDAVNERCFYDLFLFKVSQIYNDGFKVISSVMNDISINVIDKIVNDYSVFKKNEMFVYFDGGNFKAVQPYQEYYFLH